MAPEHSPGMVEGTPLGELAEIAPVALIGLLLVVSVWWDGAFDLRYWAPLTILSLALLLAMLLPGTLELPRRGPLALSLAAIWSFAAFVLLTALWAKSPMTAWTEAARAAFYAAIWTLAVGVGARGVWRSRLGGALVVAVGAIALITLVGLLVDGPSLFLAGRLESPIGYRNGTAALFAFGAWPLIGYAARRGGGSATRAAAFAGAVLVLGLAFLTQSRGVVIGLAIGAVVSLAIGPDRLRRAWVAIAALAAIAVVSGALLTPYDAFTAGTLVVGEGDIRHAGLALAGAVAVAFLAGLFFAVYDNGLRSAAFADRVRSVAGAALVILVVGVGIIGVAKAGNPVDYANTKLNEFKEIEPSSTGGSTRLGSVGGQRSDLWRVAWDEFKENPLAGDGAGSYQFAYYRHRHTDRNLSDPHSLPLTLLAETGLIGFLLFGLWLAAIGAALIARAREVGAGERAWVAGLAAAGATVLAQCLTDWLWLLPGLLGLAVLALGLAASGEEMDVRRPSGRWSPPRLAAAAAFAAVLVSVLFLFLGDFYERKARVDAFESPAAELSAARTAAWFNPPSVTPLYLQASALETEGRRSEAKRALEDALAKEPENFVTLGLLGDFEVRGGNDVAARRYYRQAHVLNPLDSGIRKLSEGAE